MAVAVVLNVFETIVNGITNNDVVRAARELKDGNAVFKYEMPLLKKRCDSRSSIGSL